MDAIASELGLASYRRVNVDRWLGQNHAQVDDFVAEEVPVVLVYNTVPHVVMLASPLDLEDFAMGFSLTEGIVAAPEDIRSIRVYQRSKGVEVRIGIPDRCHSQLPEKGKNMTGRTGCGLCGATTLEQAIRQPPLVGAGQTLDVDLLNKGFSVLQQKQTLNNLTGAVHAAAWLTAEGIANIREDVGRHNALDKLIGCLSRRECPFEEGWLLVTSRASYEMVQKAASVGITLLAAISAPTALAIRLADQCGLTLVGFTRNDSHVVYTHPHRLKHFQNIVA